MPFKSNSQIRWNNAVPEPSMYSVYFSGEMAGDRASSRRSSCLRSSNRSVRKSFPSQVNRSNAKKHGGFSTAKQQIFEVWSATSIQGANFAVNDCSRIRQRIGD